ncbi:MAG TPA: pilin [Steroidobacteraceae bacterium]|nr:pilin [Steroidobacteraceae bacterium]
MKLLQRGFTLIELMIVVAIIGILAAIAIPAYQDYTIRAQVTEGINLADAVKVAVADYYTQNGAFPAAGLVTAAPAGLGFTAASTGKYGTVDILAAGVIQATFAGTIVNAKLAAAGTNVLGISAFVTTNGDLVWQCGVAAAPTVNIATAGAANGTTVPAKWLPASCK